MPDGIEYEVLVDGTKSISAGIREIFETLVIALILVILIIFIFLQDWRATLIPLIAIPVSIVGTFMVFPLLGFTINIISLLGLVLSVGLVVDDAIVVVEAVQVGIEQGKTPFEATVEAMQRVSGAVIATSVVLLAVFIPVSFTAGITGKLIQQFAITISVAIIFSTINALTLTPALCAVLLKQRSAKSSGFFGWFNRGFNAFMGRYVALTSRVVTHTKAVFASVLVIIVGIVALWYLLPKGFLPAEDQGYLMVSVNTPAASSLQVTERALERIDSHILARGDVASSAVVAGFNMLSGTAQTNSGVIFVKLTDYNKRTLTASQISAELTE
jgi:HAE1 family hydrophobic/amphiphilic exporter-1